MNEIAPKLNWTRGAFRVWIVASVAWFGLAGYSLFVAYPGVGEFPNSYRYYLPDCPLEEPMDPEMADYYWSDDARAVPLRVCSPPLVQFLSADSDQVVRAQAAYERCLAARDREAAELERLRSEEHEACIARQESPDAATAAKSALRRAQLEWFGGAALRLLALLAVPIAVWFLLLWTFRLGRWIFRGFAG